MSNISKEIKYTGYNAILTKYYIENSYVNLIKSFRFYNHFSASSGLITSRITLSV